MQFVGWTSSNPLFTTHSTSNLKYSDRIAPKKRTYQPSCSSAPSCFSRAPPSSRWLLARSATQSSGTDAGTSATTATEAIASTANEADDAIRIANAAVDTAALTGTGTTMNR